jgi:hypothetical protein
MQNRIRHAWLLALVLGCAALQGCTEEKALALKAAAQAFSDRTAEAIDAEVELYVTKAVGRRTELEMTQDAVGLIKEAGLARRTVSNDEFQDAEQMIFARQTVVRGTAPLLNLKQAYAEFAAAFTRLPEGSALAAQRVLEVRMRLLEPATATLPQDLVDARQLKGAIDSAANTQQLVMALVRFIALVSKF